MTATKRTYPRKAEIARMLAVAKDSGEKVSGYEVDPDGTIRILFGAPMAGQGVGPYERWKAKQS